MSQSLNRVLIHLIFSTKHRQHLIDSTIEAELHEYLGGICKSLDCPPFQVGGFTDHIHILCGFSKKITIINLMEEVKKRSSKWIKTKGSEYAGFFWQDGYAVFSVNPSERLHVVNYIKNQHEHHGVKSFKNECRILFNQNDVEFDERYVWD